MEKELHEDMVIISYDISNESNRNNLRDYLKSDLDATKQVESTYEFIWTKEYWDEEAVEDMFKDFITSKDDKICIWAAMGNKDHGFLKRIILKKK